jgi:hypothetical protein
VTVSSLEELTDSKPAALARTEARCPLQPAQECSVKSSVLSSMWDAIVQAKAWLSDSEGAVPVPRRELAVSLED